jgi:hypothetical protein
MRTGSHVAKAEALVPSAYSTECYSRGIGKDYTNIKRTPTRLAFLGTGGPGAPLLHATCV